jgi:hypothetical protein
VVDLDYSMNLSSVSVDRFNYSYNRMNSAEIIPLFFFLLKNNSNFQHKFVNTFCDYANEVCNPIKANSVLQKLKEKDVIEMLTDSQKRWGRCDKNFNSTHYMQNINNINEFFKKRGNFTLKHMKDFLKLNEI